LCGCNGVTYAGAGVAAGVAIQATGACSKVAGSTRKCTSQATDCSGAAAGAVCNLMVDNLLLCPVAAAVVNGTCWVVPEPCPAAGNAGIACATGSQCAYACDLIQAQAPWYTPISPCTPM
jgi:hypothetical protein